LFPAVDSCEDAFGIGGPDEWFGIGACFGDEAVDSGFQIVDGSEDTALAAPARELGKVLPFVRVLYDCLTRNGRLAAEILVLRRMVP